MLSKAVGQSKRSAHVAALGLNAVAEAELLVNLVTARILVMKRITELREMGDAGDWAADQYMDGLGMMDELIEMLRSDANSG